MLRIILVLLFMSLSVISNSFAAELCYDAAKQFEEATAVYLKKGGAAFIERVLKNGPLEGDKRSLSDMQGPLNQIEQFFGPIQSSSIVSKKQLGTNVCYLIGVLEYTKGPAFIVATYYRGQKGVGATSMFFKTEPEKILPSQMLIQ